MGDLSYDYKDFSIENHNITFGSDGDGVLISFPVADDTPGIIKNKVNELICQAINEWLSNDEIEGCMPTAENLLLDARMQINYSYGKEPHYYVDVTISDLYPEVGMGIWIRKDANIQYETSSFRNEFITYCRYQLDKILFRK